MTAGQDFIRRIRPVGAALFLLLAVAVAAVCLTSGRDPIPGYQAPQDTAYYAANPAALQAELEANVFPHLNGVRGCREADGKLEIILLGSDYAVTRAAILRYFDRNLFIFTEE